MAKNARFEDGDYSFVLHDNPFAGEIIHPGPYRIGKNVEDANTYRVGHPLAQRVIDRAKAGARPVQDLVFDLTGSGKNIAILKPLIGQSGWLRCTKLAVTALEAEDNLLFSGIVDGGDVLDIEQSRRFFDLLADGVKPCAIPPEAEAKLDDVTARAQTTLLEELGTRNGQWFDTEMEKLDRWAEDRRASLKAELDELDEALKIGRKAARMSPNLPEKLERQREVRKLEGRRDDAWRAFDQASRDLDKQKDTVLDQIAKRLEQHVDKEMLFTLRWHLI